MIGRTDSRLIADFSQLSPQLFPLLHNGLGNLIPLIVSPRARGYPAKYPDRRGLSLLLTWERKRKILDKDLEISRELPILVQELFGSDSLGPFASGSRLGFLTYLGAKI